jgi:hypothetical protein
MPESYNGDSNRAISRPRSTLRCAAAQPCTTWKTEAATARNATPAHASPRLRLAGNRENALIEEEPMKWAIVTRQQNLDPKAF